MIKKKKGSLYGGRGAVRPYDLLTAEIFCCCCSHLPSWTSKPKKSEILIRWIFLGSLFAQIWTYPIENEYAFGTSSNITLDPSLIRRFVHFIPTHTQTEYKIKLNKGSTHNQYLLVLLMVINPCSVWTICHTICRKVVNSQSYSLQLIL